MASSSSWYSSSLTADRARRKPSKLSRPRPSLSSSSNFLRSAGAVRSPPTRSQSEQKDSQPLSPSSTLLAPACCCWVTQ
eukprot:750746-Hanusia_phi.AAC.2